MVLGGYTLPVSLLLPRRCNSIVPSSPYCPLDSHRIIAPGGTYTTPLPCHLGAGARGFTQPCFSSASSIPTPGATQPSPSEVPVGERAQAELVPLKAHPRSRRPDRPGCFRPACVWLRSAQPASASELEAHVRRLLSRRRRGRDWPLSCLPLPPRGGTPDGA